MKLKTQKRLLNVITVLVLLLSGVVFYQLLSSPLGPVEDAEISINKTSSRSETASSKEMTTLSLENRVWQRQLRRPLYDPPPPPTPKPQPRPIRVKLVGTILEGANSQAFIRQQNGSVELKRIGDPLTDDPLDGTVQEIAANEITFVREDGEHRLVVEGSR